MEADLDCRGCVHSNCSGYAFWCGKSEFSCTRGGNPKQEGCYEWDPIFEVGKCYPSLHGKCRIDRIEQNGMFYGTGDAGDFGLVHASILEPVPGRYDSDPPLITDD